MRRKEGGGSLQDSLKNEQFILGKLKLENKTAAELGYIQLYDYIDEGHLVAKVVTMEETKAEQEHHKSSDDKTVHESVIETKTIAEDSK